jgi:aminopeptidase N
MNRTQALSFIVFILIVFVSCRENNGPKQGSGSIDIPQEDRHDYHSYARPDEAKATHIQLDLKVDFETQTIAGEATYTIEHQNGKEFILDTKDMDILEVLIGPDKVKHTFKLGDEDPLLGQALIIPLNSETESITVVYRTRPEAAAIQWLTPAQAKQETPFLYTQSQAILARTWIPCQDSPGIRFTYDARVQVPDDLIALMSAENPTMKNSRGVYTFRMTQPIPAYLLALAVGDIDYRPYDRRVGIYAQPNLLLSAAYEFMDTEKMVDVTEAMFGPFRWDRYDLLILPSSFPFGGMENPRLAFITPSIITGERSLTTLIAHELAHSWSGNLVTNATWNDFWLNEGFTVYLERRIMEDLYGKDMGDMLAALGYQSLQKTLDKLGRDSPDTRLKLNLKGRNPDDGLTRIAYDKGYFFLRTMEHIYGRAFMDKFLNAWFRDHAFKSVSTEDFVRYVKPLLHDGGKALQMEAWIYGTGIPENCIKIEAEPFAAVDQILTTYDGKNHNLLDTTGWSAQAWIHFLRHLPANTDLAGLNQQFELASSNNYEYRAAFLEQCIAQGYIQPIKQDLERFLLETGRRKFLTPIYGGLMEAGETDFAWQIYTKARPGYHTVSTQTLDEMFSKKGKQQLL